MLMTQWTKMDILSWKLFWKELRLRKCQKHSHSRDKEQKAPVHQMFKVKIIIYRTILNHFSFNRMAWEENGNNLNILPLYIAHESYSEEPSKNSYWGTSYKLHWPASFKVSLFWRSREERRIVSIAKELDTWQQKTVCNFSWMVSQN